MKYFYILKKFPWIVPTFIFSFLLIMGALAHPLWGDEAETAFFAKTILQTGLPKGFDGVNMSAVNEATVLNKDLINHVTPPLQYYLTAISFFIFGQSAFIARLPFLMFGVANIILFYFLCLKLAEWNKVVPVMATFIYSLSVPIILFSQQARYYSLTVFSGLLLCYSSLFLLEKKRSLWPYVAFIFGGIIYSYSHYLTFLFFYPSLYIALIIYFLVNKKLSDVTSFTFKYILLGIAICALFIPWYLFFDPSENQQAFINLSFYRVIERFPNAFLSALSYFNFYNIFPYIFFLALPIIFICKKNKQENFSLLLLFFSVPIMYLFFLAFFAAVVSANYLIIFHSRYNVVLMPFFILLISMIFYEIGRLNKLISITIFLVYITTTFFTFHHYRSLIWDYLWEVASPYHTSDELVAQYLKENAKEGDTAFLNYDRSHEPLIFMLGDKIKFVNRITPFNGNVSPLKNPALPKYLYNYLDDPDWIILYSKYPRVEGAQLLLDIRNPNVLGRTKKIDLANDYTEIVIPVFFGSDIARPEIEWRSFEKIVPTYEQQVFIYRKKK